MEPAQQVHCEGISVVLFHDILHHTFLHAHILAVVSEYVTEVGACTGNSKGTRLNTHKPRLMYYEISVHEKNNSS